MWRLRIAEGGGDPWLRTKNGHVGRQVWEFDAAADPDPAVNAARRAFVDNRRHLKHSADLLMRIQFSKQNSSDARHLPYMEKKKVQEDEQVTEEMTLNSLRRGLDHFSSLQSSDGHWPGDFGGITTVGPTLIIALYVTRSLNTVISPEHRREMCRYIYNHQNEDGGWSAYIRGTSCMFGTCLNYIALRLLGEEPNDKNNTLDKGRVWILSHGGAILVPLFGKIWLSILGVYDWSGNNPYFPELWLVPRFLPFYPGSLLDQLHQQY